MRRQVSRGLSVLVSVVVAACLIPGSLWMRHALFLCGSCGRFCVQATQRPLQGRRARRILCATGLSVSRQT